MNCRETERELLLDESGELSPARRAALERHLTTCASCEARRDEYAQWSRFVRSTTIAPAPADALIAQVLRDAATRRPVRPLILFPVWRAALAAAAGLVILAGLAAMLAVRSTDTTPEPAGTARLVEVSSLLGMLMEHNQDAAEAHDAMVDGDLQGFARQLLILEGLDVDVVEEPADEVIRLEGLQPTTLQWHSTPGLPSETCV